jgi:hypothetical protein
MSDLLPPIIAGLRDKALTDARDELDGLQNGSMQRQRSKSSATSEAEWERKTMTTTWSYMHQDGLRMGSIQKTILTFVM